MSRTDRKNLLRSRFAVMHGAILAARFLTPSAHAESVTLAPVPPAHNPAQLSPNERAALASDVLAYRIARDLQNARENVARGYALAIVA